MPSMDHHLSWEAATWNEYNDDIQKIAARDKFVDHKSIEASKVTRDLLQTLRACLIHDLSPVSAYDRECIMMEIHAKAYLNTRIIARRFATGSESWGKIFLDYLTQRMKRLEKLGMKGNAETFPGQIVRKDLTAKCWAKWYTGTTLKELWKRIRKGERDQRTNGDKRPKFIRIVQTTGTGKSRLLDAIGKGMAGITFVLRKPGGEAFPPTDTCVYQYLQAAKHHRAAPIIPMMALIIGTFMAVGDELQESLKTGESFVVFLARLSQKTDHLVDSRTGRLLDKKTQKPVTPPRRERFLRTVLKYARDTEIKVEDMQHRRKREHHAAARIWPAQEVYWTTREIWEMYCELRHRVGCVTNLLKQFKPAETETLSTETVFIAFDGAGEGLDKIVYQTVEDVFKKMYTLPFWGFFATSIPDDLPTVPLYTCKETGEVYKLPLEALRPAFTDIDYNIESSRLLVDPKTREEEQAIPLSEFATIPHMTKFGRAVWTTYADLSSHTVKLKIQNMVRSNPEESSPFQDLDKAQHFTLLAARLHLHVSLDAARTGCAEKIVIENLRVMSGQDLVKNFTYTTTGSEPLVANVAAEYMMTHHRESETAPNGLLNWERALHSLIEMLSGGLLYHEKPGHIFARIICLLSHDRALNHLEDKGCLRFSQPLTVKSWLSHLLSPKMVEQVSVGPDFTKILDGWINFMHFTPTSIPLSQQSLPHILQLLLRQQCALTLDEKDTAEGHFMIPVHMGGERDPVKAKSVTAIIVRVCKEREGKIPLIGTEFRKCFGEIPVLVVQMEIGPGSWNGQGEGMGCWGSVVGRLKTLGVGASGWSEFGCLGMGDLGELVTPLWEVTMGKKMERVNGTWVETV